jgi:hypothetical protein
MEMKLHRLRVVRSDAALGNSMDTKDVGKGVRKGEKEVGKCIEKGAKKTVNALR